MSARVTAARLVILMAFALVVSGASAQDDRDDSVDDPRVLRALKRLQRDTRLGIGIGLDEYLRRVNETERDVRTYLRDEAPERRTLILRAVNFYRIAGVAMWQREYNRQAAWFRPSEHPTIQLCDLTLSVVRHHQRPRTANRISADVVTGSVAMTDLVQACWKCAADNIDEAESLK